MRLIKEHKFISVLIVAAVIITVLGFVMAFSTSEEEMQKEAESIRKTIEERALQCYVIEDAYPESLSYLENNYGLAVNKEDYKIVYTPYAENMPPEIKVIYIGKK